MRRFSKSDVILVCYPFSMAALLFGVEARDPRVFAGVALALVTVALVANALPALRAARLDAIRVLREE